MLTISLFAFGLIGASFVLLAPVLVQLAKSSSIDELTPEWLAAFNPATYRPMHVLLSREDFQFLARQPGFDLSLYRKLRRERMLIFRQYLRRLICDFNRLHAYARLAIAHSDTDQSSVMLHLAALKFKFTINVLHAELSYYFCLLGIGSLATHGVVARLEELCARLGLGNPVIV